MNKIWSKRIHNLFGISSAVFLTVLLVTGVLLNHPSSLQKESLETAVRDPFHPGKIYLGRKDGLYFSLDGGKTLEEVPMLYPALEVTDIAFSSLGEKTVLAVEKWGRVLLSRDGGATWDRVPLPFDAQTQGIELKKISLGPDGAILLLTSHGWLETRDRGREWNQENFHPQKMPLYRLVKMIHNGYFFGPMFVWVYDFAAAALLILIATGIYLWYIGRQGT